MPVGTTILATWGVLTASVAVVAAAAMGLLFSTGLATWNEDRELSERFGDDWRGYRSHVRLWVPRRRPHAADATVFVGTTCEPCSDVGRFLIRHRPRRLVIAAAEESPDAMTRITYRAAGVGSETGLAALGRSVEHINLAWAIVSWAVRLPLVRPLLQLVTDAVGGGPRELPRRRQTLNR
jgi:predicted DCC family thiol-disulfide oxidoreductase YuxK